METEMAKEVVYGPKLTEEYMLDLKDKFGDDNRILRVYVDEENKKYFIDTFAAYSLGFIDYETACKDTEIGKTYFEISPSVLEQLKQVFEGKIEYVPLNSVKKDGYLVEENNYVDTWFDNLKNENFPNYGEEDTNMKL